MMIGLIVLPEKFTPPGVPVPSTMVDIASLSVRTAVAQAAVLIMWGKVVEWWNGHHPAGASVLNQGLLVQSVAPQFHDGRHLAVLSCNSPTIKLIIRHAAAAQLNCSAS